VTSEEGQLALSKAQRSPSQQAVAGRADRLPDDQGGHLIASIFNGMGEAINLKAMNGSFNMKEFRNLERTLEDALKAGKPVEVKIDIIHSGDSARPDGFVINYKIDGAPSQQIFENKAGG
jgi:DNA/RNA non-specific endonuclease